MKIIKIIISLFLMIGVISPILSVFIYNNEHRVIFTPISILSAFIGTGLMFGFKGFKTEPKYIGNLDETTQPVINQTWMVFFIALVWNLLMANLCGW